MQRFSIFIISAITVCAGLPRDTDDLVLVNGGAFVNTRSNFHGKGTRVADFYIGKHEVTQKEWSEVMGANPSQFKGENSPVETVSWYDCVGYCNKRSLKEGLKPYYNIDKTRKDPQNQFTEDGVKWLVTINPEADGYRLPTEAEWEYAAGGGQASKSYTYSGGDDIDKVAWYWQNSGDVKLGGFWSSAAVRGNHSTTKAVGRKDANELGIHDMSGNVREWCWDSQTYVDKNGPVEERVFYRVLKGGGWLGGDFCCASSYRGGDTASSRNEDTGFRVCRNK